MRVYPWLGTHRKCRQIEDPMQKRPRRGRADVWAKFERLVKELLQEETLPAEDRFDGLILAMRAHGLPCDQERVQKIRKLWMECVAARQRPRKKP